jgi:hypothetical protein
MRPGTSETRPLTVAKKLKAVGIKLTPTAFKLDAV